MRRAGVYFKEFAPTPCQKFLVSAELAHLRRVSHNPKAILQGETAHQKFQDATLDVSWQWKGFNHLKLSLVIVAPFPKQPPPAVRRSDTTLFELPPDTPYTLCTLRTAPLGPDLISWAEVAELSWSQMEMLSVCIPELCAGPKAPKPA